jgi:hypothetical protein
MSREVTPPLAPAAVTPGEGRPKSLMDSAAWPLLLAFGTMALRLWFSQRTGTYFEDALITLRYVENLLAGRGFVYNVGEHVLGTTTPLYTLLLVLLGFVFGPGSLQGLSTGLGILCSGVSAWLIWVLSRQLRLPQLTPLVACALVAIDAQVMTVSVSGMETSLVVTLMLASLCLYVGGRRTASAVVLAALVLCRVDAMLWVVLIAALAWWEQRRFPLRELLVFCAVLAPWVLFAFAYFGSPIPQTVTAKAVAYVPGWKHGLGGLYGQFMAIFTPVHEKVDPFGLRWLLDIFWAVGAVQTVRRYRRALPLTAFGVLYFAYLLFQVPRLFQWYLVPWLVALFLVAALGFGTLADVLARRLRPRVLWMGVAAVPPLLLLVHHGIALAQSVERMRQYMENELAVRVALGEWLKAHTPASATVYTEAIGYIGYYSERYIWDSVGLVSPQLTDFRKRFPDNRWFYESLKALRPDYVVLRTYERKENTLFPEGGPLLSGDAMAWFDAAYRLEREFTAPNASWGKLGSMSLYNRVEEPAAP